MSSVRTGAKPFRWLLLASLGLNVALIAAIVMTLSGWYQPQRGGHRGHNDMPSPRLLLAALSEPRQGALDEIYDQHRQTVRAAMRERRKARRAVGEQMLGAEFDAQRIDQAFAHLRLKDEQAAVAVQSMLTALLEQLTAEERAKVVALLPNHRRQHQRRHRDQGQRRAENKSVTEQTDAESAEQAE